MISNLGELELQKYRNYVEKNNFFEKLSASLNFFINLIIPF
jgi:hypothetical protein